MDLDNFIVKWIDENPIRFSIMQRHEILVEDNRRKNGEELTGTIILWKWKSLQCRGEIVKYGSKKEMQNEIKLLTSLSADEKTQPKRIRKRNAQESASVVAKRTRIDATLQGIQLIPDDDPKDIKIRDLEDQLASEILKRLEAEEICRELQRKLEERVDAHSDVDIGNGIFVKQQTLSAIRTVSGPMNIYARNIFRTLFGVDEVVGRSLIGKGCNANKNLPKLASIDPVRRDAIIDHSLKVFGKSPGSEFYKLSVKDMKKVYLV